MNRSLSVLLGFVVSVALPPRAWSQATRFLPTELVGTKVRATFTACKAYAKETESIPAATLILPDSGTTECFSNDKNVRAPERMGWTVTRWPYETLFSVNSVSIKQLPANAVEVDLENIETNEKAIVFVKIPDIIHNRVVTKEDLLESFWRQFESDSKYLEQSAAIQAKASQFQHTPKPGKPSFTETAKWIKDNLPSLKFDGDMFFNDTDGNGKLSYRYPVEKMDACVLVYTYDDESTHPGSTERKSTVIVPLSDVLQIEDGKDGYLLFSHELRLKIQTKHNGVFRITHNDDYDSTELAARIVKALQHAATLCEQKAKTNEPF